MPNTRDPVFNRVLVDYAVRGVTRVSWELRPHFLDRLPHTFTLQVNRDGGNPEDWKDVGLPIVNGFVGFDDTPRMFGARLPIVYRVKLETPRNTYYSTPAQVYGSMSVRQWLNARAMIRRVWGAPRGLEQFYGYLLKRKVHGTVCECVDPYTGGITDSNCVLCHGTGKIDGYWKAVEDSMYDLTPVGDTSEVDAALKEGQILDEVRKGEFKCPPIVAPRDVWVMRQSDERYYVKSVETMSEIANVPILVTATLVKAPLGDQIYEVPLDGS